MHAVAYLLFPWESVNECLGMYIQGYPPKNACLFDITEKRNPTGIRWKQMLSYSELYYIQSYHIHMLSWPVSVASARYVDIPSRDCKRVFVL